MSTPAKGKIKDYIQTEAVRLDLATLSKRQVFLTHLLVPVNVEVERFVEDYSSGPHCLTAKKTHPSKAVLSNHNRIVMKCIKLENVDIKAFC